MNFADLAHKTIQIPLYFAAPVFVEEITQEDDDLYYLRVRTDSGQLQEAYLSEEEVANALSTITKIAETAISAEEQSLLVEAERIRLAYAYDPHFAVSLSGVEPLPHQLEAVYERMLPQARLRFLLADDPGAGKTIMAGLLIKELKMRNAIERILVLCPAPLTIQWQDEMRSKFDEIFEVIRSSLAKDQLAGNVWERFPQCVASIDFAKQDDVSPDLLRAEWDLVIIDEAHKCAARWFGNEVKRTKRYMLAEQLSQQTDKLLLLTATPHSGDPAQFAYFLRLLDSDQFVGPDRVDEYAQLNQQALIPYSGEMPSPWFLRRAKEDLRNFDGEKLFTQRHASTVPFELSEREFQLYIAVTEYINKYLPKQSGRKKAPVALARTVLQRRLASSIRAIKRSLERRFERFSTILREVESMPANKQALFLQRQNLLEGYDDEQDTDDADEMLFDAATIITAADRIFDLQDEVATLQDLVNQAQRLEALGVERKLSGLLSKLNDAQFQELRDGRGKLLIFTEHRDTLSYLRENLEKDYMCVEIHGGMNAQHRKEAQDLFRTSAQICLATDAAGEGINLQFCHLMINYDMPWNPNRLEQRMGRIHRIGQKRDVYIFNFAATNTVEGRVISRLLEKLEDIKKSLGDRVFDVIGMMLKVNGIDLEDILREAAHNPRTIDDEFYTQQIEHLSADRLQDLEQATGVAMATSHVDLGRIQAEDYRSEERRLMPEYVEKYFIAAAEVVGLRVEQRADALYRIEHVPQRMRSVNLTSVRKFGPPSTSYRKLTFNKYDILNNPQHTDAELLSPGHSLFAALSEVLENQLASVRNGTAIYADPLVSEPYNLHFFTTDLVGEEPVGNTYRPVVQYASMTVVLENSGGDLEVAPPDILHDLQPINEGEVKRVDASTRQIVEKYLQRTVQRSLLLEQREQREREIEIRRSYLEQTFTALISVQQQKYWELADKAMNDPKYNLARDEAERRMIELEERQRQKLEDLKHLRILRPGGLRYIGSASVRPADMVSNITLDMHRDPEVERRAMEYVMQYETERGWLPTDVSQLHDGSGFDIRSIGPVADDGKRPVRRIEVKGRSGYDKPVVLTTNEWTQANRHQDTYWLYVIWGSGQDQEQKLLKIQNPALKLADVARPIIKHYLLAADALIRTNSEK